MYEALSESHAYIHTTDSERMAREGDLSRLHACPRPAVCVFMLLYMWPHTNSDIQVKETRRGDGLRRLVLVCTNCRHVYMCRTVSADERRTSAQTVCTNCTTHIPSATHVCTTCQVCADCVETVSADLRSSASIVVPVDSCADAATKTHCIRGTLKST